MLDHTWESRVVDGPALRKFSPKLRGIILQSPPTPKNKKISRLKRKIVLIIRKTN